MWFTWSLDAFDGVAHGLGDWLILCAFDLAAVAFMTWAVAGLWRRT